MRRVAAVLLAAVTVAEIAAPAAAQRPIVVELFTSQGCSSCPPADALLRELAARPGLLALGYHIDYWDGPGWTDPLSLPEATARQRAYARLFGHPGRVYTPQTVIDGRDEFVGSDRAAIADALRAARPESAAPVAFAAGSVRIGAGTGRGAVWLVRFARRRTTRVGGGENRGRVLDDADGVTAVVRLGDWNGAAASFPLAPPGPGEGAAVLVQAADGTMLGAGAIYSDATGMAL
jgi:hypothetical protein